MALIDRDRLLSERMKSKYYHLPNGDIAVPLIDIENAPVVDAVPVVRCKDCRFSDWYTAVDGKERCYCMIHGTSGHEEMDFCSYGERDSDT